MDTNEVIEYINNELLKEEIDSTYRKKLEVIKCLYDGDSVSFCSQQFDVPKSSIYGWKKEVEEKGISIWKDKKTGRPSKLTDKQLNKIKEDVKKSPQLSGYMKSKWTGSLLVNHIKKLYGVKVTERYCQKILYEFREPILDSEKEFKKIIETLNKVRNSEEYDLWYIGCSKLWENTKFQKSQRKENDKNKISKESTKLQNNQKKIKKLVIRDIVTIFLAQRQGAEKENEIQYTICREKSEKDIKSEYNSFIVKIIKNSLKGKKIVFVMSASPRNRTMSKLLMEDKETRDKVEVIFLTNDNKKISPLYKLITSVKDSVNYDERINSAKGWRKMPSRIVNKIKRDISDKRVTK